MSKRNSSCFCGATLIPFRLVQVVRNFLLLRNGICGARVGRAEKKKERQNKGSQNFLKHGFKR